ncbi:DUF3019 domain-containing protein [Alteromonas sp. KUL49]|uniref:DUF3019 domain-containing protein n=1 Tax=Alteromonas sp. KUL49 TaxID=2480798 RepID=UPI00102EE18A|nr:DUF3019 domain-containing protein [Alteromonas sp. KUL49]TAP37365.1 DUF3019 domain-containing protein [Alteromonas sp. KUL49]GEA12999.1 hypothetical protein KUL49_33740 [Alteromonas sp. KUL49]
MRYITRNIAIATFAFISAQVWAQEQSWFSTQSVAKYMLSIKPQICEVKEFGEYCDVSIFVSALEPSIAQVCLYKEECNEPLWCGMVSDSETKLAQQLVNENQRFYLAEGELEVAAVDFRVAVFQPAQTRKRRRYGLGL